MAIAFDAAAGASTVASTHTSQTWSHTTTGSDLIMLANIGTYNSTGGGKVSGMTYNGVSMSLYSAEQAWQSNQYVSTFYLYAPSTGANSVVASFASQTYSWGASATYTGVAQTGFPDNDVGGVGSGTSWGTSITPVASDCWVVMLATGNRDKSAGTNMTMRVEHANNSQGVAIGDSNAAYSTAMTLGMTQSVSDSYSFRTFTIAPVAAASSSISAITGVSQASLTSYLGVANANIASVNGVANS